MNSFQNITVRTKLMLVLGVILALFVIAVTVSYLSIASLLAAQTEARAKQLNVVLLSNVLATHNEGRVSVLMVLVSRDNAEKARWSREVESVQQQNNSTLDELRRTNAYDAEFLSRLRDHHTLRQEFITTRQRVLDLALAGNTEAAMQISLGENNARYERLRDIITDLVTSANNASLLALEHSQRVADSSRRVFIAVGSGVFLTGLLGVFVLGRSLANPLQVLVNVAQRVTAGDLTATVPLTGRRDEIGLLAQSFATMLANFRTVHREIQEGVNVLASSASEIFTATAQIAASATETATAVSQTTSTAEEVKQTAQVSAQKAGNVADIAQRAAQSAQVGRKAIEESIAGMNHVREQMEAIAETVVRLSEQSQAISEITASVNDLAEQSNLLAVNASIEAAKAGEHGRGFAVVAQEIRNLATQSKESTAQIRGILNEIQRATTATVMAAEQGSKAVEAGVKQVNQSGDAIRTLAESIVSAAQAATQITASAQEQLIGIDQVTIAIQNILQASKQNATGTQQAESGAKTLNQLGQNLKAIAQKFSV